MDFTSYGIKKRVDELGRVVIPKEFREQAGIFPEQTVEICQVNEGILVRPIKEDNDEN